MYGHRDKANSGYCETRRRNTQTNKEGICGCIGEGPKERRSSSDTGEGESDSEEGETNTGEGESDSEEGETNVGEEESDIGEEESDNS